jgi:hypothetical protein
MVHYNFLKLLPHLQPKAALNQLLGASGGKGTFKKLMPYHTLMPSPYAYKGRRENKQICLWTGMPASGHSGNTCHS